MDYLQVCAKAFEHLLDTKYHIVIGRKGKLTELNLLFDPTEFHHLIGLHKIFRQILDGSLSMEDLKKSRYFSTIQNEWNLSARLKTSWTAINSFFDTIKNFNPFR